MVVLTAVLSEMVSNGKTQETFLMAETAGTFELLDVGDKNEKK